MRFARADASSRKLPELVSIRPYCGADRFRLGGSRAKIPPVVVVYHGYGGRAAVNFANPIIESEYVFKHKPVRLPGEELYVHPTYTIPEAAEYLAMDSWTLHSWYADEILKPSGWYGKHHAFPLLSFRDIEEAYKIYLLRTKFGYSMQRIREALPKARRVSGSEHPLITHNFIAFKELCIELRGRKKTDRFVESLGPVQRPLLIPEVTDAWGKRIVSRGKGRIQIFPWRFAEEDEVSRPVSLDPEVMSGRLVVTGTRIPVVVLRSRNLKGESPSSIASDYGIDEDVVQKALDHIGKAA